jgi:hypothetical protein
VPVKTVPSSSASLAKVLGSRLGSAMGGGL